MHFLYSNDHQIKYPRVWYTDIDEDKLDIPCSL